MPFQVSPGVNVSEIDLTTVVPAVSSTEGAIAGHFAWGPVDQRVLIDSEDRLVNIYNKPKANTATDFFTAANFLAYGNALYVNRVVASDAYNAVAGNTSIDTVTVKNEDDYNENYTTSSSTEWVAKYPGELGNSLKVSVCDSANAWQSTVSTNYNATKNSANITFEGASTDATDFLAVGDLIVVGAAKETLQVSSISGNTVVTSTAFSGTTTANTSGMVRRWEYFNSFDNAPGTSASATAAGGQDDELHIAVIDEDGAISGVKGAVLEAYANVSKASDARTEQGAGNYFKEVVNQNSPYLWWGGSDAADWGGASTTNFTVNALPKSLSMVGGTDGAKPTSAQKITGYDIFKSAEDVDISFLLGSDADATLATHLITNIAESRKDCIAVLSPERADCVNNNSYAGKERDDIIEFRDSLPSSSYAVLDSGWKYQYDKYNDLYRYVPLNADTAGLMVQTDTTRDPWYSPAGFNRGNVKNCIRLAYNPAKGDRDQLYKKGINPVVTFPGQGTVLFGDKTMLAKPSAFDRINVRRLFIVLEKAISTASKFTLFEFNDEFTRSQFRNLVEPFLRDVQGRRGITDFRVVCDSTNNTGEVIDRNEFIGDIYIKPARSINFIQLNFVAVRTGVEFSEVVGQFG
jgi:phage tail sheath protein FI